MKNPDAVVHRLAQRVSHQHRAAEGIALLKARLQAVELRARTRLCERDVGKSWIGAQVERRSARARLIDVARRNQIAPARSHVGHLGDAGRAELALQRHVELVQIRRAQIALESRRRIRRRNREVGRERIGQRDEPERRREIRGEIEIRRAEIQPLARCKRRMVVMNAIGGAHNRGRSLIHRPGRADARRKVVPVGFIARPREAVGAHRLKVSDLRVVERGAIVYINRRRRKVVPQPRRQRQVRTDTVTVLYEPRVRLRSQTLRIVQPRERREGRQPAEQINQRAAREGARKRQRATRLNVSERNLADQPRIHAPLDEMIAARPGECVGDMDGVGRAALRIVVLVADRRISADRNEAEPCIARVRPRLGQAHSAVDRAALFRKHTGRYTVEPDARFVEQAVAT